MERPNAVILAGGLVALWIVLTGAALAPGALLIGKHEGDTLHMLQILLRMEQGQVPHMDFMTPIGIFAFAPIVLFLKAGFGVGLSMVLGQSLVALGFLPLIWWVASSRFQGAWSFAFGAVVLVLVLGLVHGTTEPSVSFSMHYNRWAWAAAFLVLAAAVLPGQGKGHPDIDGLVIGLGLSAMALTKVTYFIAFAPAVAIALLARGALRSLGVGVATGLVVVALVTGVMTVEFWLAWIADLRTVAGSIVRPQPGLGLSAVIGAPSHMAGTVILILSVILLRQGERPVEGLVLLILVPGFLYVTWQNWGNDPQWLMLLGFLMFALVPGRELHNVLGWNVTAGIGLAGMAAMALSAPSFINMAWSPLRHLNADPADYAPLLAGQGRHEDLHVANIRNLEAIANRPMGLEGAPEQVEAVAVNGEDLPVCNLDMGMGQWYSAVASRLADSGLAQGQGLFTTDVLNAFWLFGAGGPLKGGAPWYYGGLTGFENADLVLVPLCPVAGRVRKLMLSEIAETGAELTEIDRNDLYILYRK